MYCFKRARDTVPIAPGRLPERPMGADCKSVGLRLRRFESYTCHRNGPDPNGSGPFCVRRRSGTDQSPGFGGRRLQSASGCSAEG